MNRPTTAGEALIPEAVGDIARLIDRVEAEGQPSAKLRVAFVVDDSQQATDTLVAAGARLIASPRETPWRSLNSRLEAPAGVQVTLFEELDGRPHDGVV